MSKIYAIWYKLMLLIHSSPSSCCCSWQTSRRQARPSIQFCPTRRCPTRRPHTWYGIWSTRNWIWSPCRGRSWCQSCWRITYLWRGTFRNLCWRAFRNLQWSRVWRFCFGGKECWWKWRPRHAHEIHSGDSRRRLPHLLRGSWNWIQLWRPSQWRYSPEAALTSI